MRRSFIAITGFIALLAGVAVAQTAGQRPSDSLDDIIAKVLAEPTPAQTAGPVPAAAAKPLAAAGQPATAPIVMSARIGEHEQMTRFVVEVSDPVKMRSFTLSNPNRVVIDMPAVQWKIGAPPKPSGTSAVRSYRYGLFRPGNSRFVIDLNQPVTINEGLVLPPSGGYGYRVVFDLYPVKQNSFDKQAGWPADLKAREEAAMKVVSLPPTPSPQARGSKKVIVLDSGHGGIDPGTSGVNGLLEKDLVLDTATRLGRVLSKRGFIVHLTRDTDTFIPLRGRVNIARAHKADLFISLHADSNPNPETSGASVYTLSDAGSDKEAEKLAKKENQSDVIAGVDLGGDNSPVAGILFDLAQRDTMNRSSRFAETVVKELGKATDILPRRPHRSAAFAVLKAPDVPAVLIELGYLSNARNAAQMNTSRWRDGVADAIADAVERHFAPAGPVTAQGANSGEPR